MAAKPFSRVSIAAALGCLICLPGNEILRAESSKTQSQQASTRIDFTDVAVGNVVDSIVQPSAKQNSTHKVAQRPTRRAVPQAQVTSGKLATNPDTSKNAPRYVLVDRYGAVLRLINGSNLESLVGRVAQVKDDNGGVLSASQLDFGVRDQDVQQVAFQENIPTPADAEGGDTDSLMPEPEEMYYGDGSEMYYDDGSGMDFGCGPTCGSGCGSCNPCGPGTRGIAYARVEYLSWWFDGMDIPGLVTAVEVADPNAGPTTEELADARDIFGPGSVFDNQRDGVRLALGLWLDDCGRCAIEGDYFTFGDESFAYRAGTLDGTIPEDTFIYRPYFNTNEFVDPEDPNFIFGRGDFLEDVDTEFLDGTVTVDITSEFQSAGIRFRHSLCCVPGCCGMGCGNCVGCGSGCGMTAGGMPKYAGLLGRLHYLIKNGTRRTDFLWGLRWARLDESLGITEDLQDRETLTDILVRDFFATENEFLGGEIGYTTEWQCNRWSLSLLSKLAIGNNRQRIFIDGYTETTESGEDPNRAVGGLLAQRTNIGADERDELSVIPELNATLGYQLTPRLRLTAGYTFLYWSNVVRPGDLIDTDINAALIPEEITEEVEENDHPRREFVTTDFWAQGLNLGGEYRW